MHLCICVYHCEQAPGERSFHVISQLVHGANDTERELYKLAAPESYRYMMNSDR